MLALVSWSLDAERRRRSWPYPPTALERLAVRAGLDDEELRELLKRLIHERLRADADEHERSVERERGIPLPPAERMRLNREEPKSQRGSLSALSALSA